MSQENLKLAIQKKGRLTEKSLQILRNCGLDIDNYSDRLMISARNFPLDILFLRDDDIPEYVQDGVADIGILGENVVVEKKANIEIVKKLGFSRCELLIGVPENKTLNEVKDLNGKTIATSYPVITQKFLDDNKITAKIVEISGSVEITTSLGVSDCICDIVSTGNTLRMNKLKKSFPVFKSEAVLVASKSVELNSEKNQLLADLLKRISSALNAKHSKYIMMNSPKDSVEKVLQIIPSLKSPTVLSLADEKSVAIHAVIPSEKFWKIVDELKAAGASGILLLPIENMIL
ncbi:MAG: ATP phosphoribosyltransferase [Melioribacteraceae bacterium]|nr:ATP phosphoribosyltransferase [Melioribacteraceae bacterium]MCF8265008.1 ATP phosphoribosyltransferase [Melioribacteraceae bacterium]MCF8413635.1 ATP phosphoribosyltransferase [Melioribacteraceae bacterium]MCF8432491.1 ATP phosphoribosyltransferase [Melioribacteraceae bacterium]